MTRLAILGASGYAGGEMLRLALGHPQLEVVQATSERHAGQPVTVVHPNLRGLTRLRFERAADLRDADVVVSALPHGELQGRIDEVAARAGTLVDLSADFRFPDPGAYARAYGRTHARPEWCERFVPAVPELTRERLAGAGYLAGAGCLATAATLALKPLASEGLLAHEDVIVDGRLGSSAAGATPGAGSHHPDRAGAVRTYAPVGHRHGPEVEHRLRGAVRVHLSATAVERVRGIQLTAHAFLREGVDEAAVDGAYREAYGDEPFVRLVRARKGAYRMPDPRILDGTNWCDLGYARDEESGRLVVVAALDNLVKGTAGHALQALNVARGWDERAGLTFAGLHP